MRRVAAPVTLTIPLLAFALACGPPPTPQPVGPAPSTQPPAAAAPASPSATAAPSSPTRVATAAMPTAFPHHTDPGVKTPQLPPPPTEFAPPIEDGHPISNPPLRDEDFPPGQYGGRLVTAAFSDPKTFNVIVANESSSTDITTRMWAAFLGYNNITQEVKPGLARAWEHDASGTVWTFHLRDGLVFSDGSPLTSEAVSRFFRVIYTPGLANPAADALRVDEKDFEIETPDPLTVVIRTPSIYSAMELQATFIVPLPSNPWDAALASSDPAAALAQLHNLDVDPATYVCSGPYMLESFRSGEATTLRRNPNYQVWDAAGRRLPNFDECVFLNVPDQNAMRLRFEAGETDDLNPLLPSWYVGLRDGAQAGGYTVWDLGPTLNKSFFWFNLKEGNDRSGEPYIDPVKLAWFQNVDFRRACAYAIDRDAMTNLLFNRRAVPEVSFESLSNIFWCNRDATHYDHDPERAKQLLDSIGMIDRDGDGVREDAQGHPIRFTMITNRGNDVRERMIVLIQEDLRAVGMRMEPSTIDFSALVERTGDTFKYDSCLLGLGGGTPDPMSGLNVLRSDGRTHLWNPSQTSPQTSAEARIDGLCEQILHTLDRQEQRRIYFEIQDIIGRESFVIYTVSPITYVGTRNRVANWCPAVVEPRTMWNLDSLWQLSPR
jgi:peptide/nickel transport system substrate-binding protein